MMRTKLTKVLSLRQAPFLKFHIDEDLKKELAVLDLLRKVAEGERASCDRQARRRRRRGRRRPRGERRADGRRDNGQPTTDTP